MNAKQMIQTRKWWIRTALICSFSTFFLAMGIDILIASYRLTNPIEFLASFFASNLVILISAVGIIYPAFQVYGLFRKNQDNPHEHDEDRHSR